MLIAHTEPEEGEDEGVIKCVPQGAFPAEAQILDGVFTLPSEPFDGEEEEDEQCRGDGIVASGEDGQGEERGGEDARDVGEGLVEVIGTEEDPGEHREGEGAGHGDRLAGRGQVPSPGDRLQVPAVFLCEQQRQEVEGVERSPDEEGPVGAVPEAAHQKDYEGVADAHHQGAAAASQRDVEVIAEPGGEGDVPPPPELCDVAREVGVGEVAHQVDAEEAGGTDGDVGVAGEVAVDLKGEEEGSQHQRAARHC